jgi:hypothetical protein
MLFINPGLATSKKGLLFDLLKSLDKGLFREMLRLIPRSCLNQPQVLLRFEN